MMTMFNFKQQIISNGILQLTETVLQAYLRAARLSPTERQPYVTKEQLPTERRGRVSVWDWQRQSWHHDMAV